MKPNATESITDNQNVQHHAHAGTFAKVMDGRKQPIRGLWVRNGRFYARLAVEDGNTGLKAVRRVPLLDSDGNPAQTVAQARVAMDRLKTQRADDQLPQLVQTPTFTTYADDYLEYIESGSGTKKLGTIAKEKTTLALWKSHLGSLRVDKIKPVHVAAFVQKRLKAGMSRRTVKLDLIALRNVLKRARDIDQHIKALPIPSGLNAELKSTSPKRPLFTLADVDKLCAAALTTKADGSPVTQNGQQFCDYIRLLAYSGARRNEALALSWKDADIKHGQLTIGSDGDTKNSTARIVDLNPKLKALLLDMKRRNKDVSKWLFPSPQRGEKDIHAQSFRESLSLARTQAKLPEIAFHDLRHHFISYAVPLAGHDVSAPFSSPVSRFGMAVATG